MNSLEFIEREIKDFEFQIKHIKSMVSRYVDYRTEGQLKIDEIQLKINHFEQIKSELEAWEIVKDNVNVYSHQGCNNVEIEYVQITEEQLPDYKHVDIIKKAKALEVTNNDS